MIAPNTSKATPAPYRSSEDERLICEDEVNHLEGHVSRVTRWRWEIEGYHPRRIKLGRRNRWRRSEILKFIKKLNAVGDSAGKRDAA